MELKYEYNPEAIEKLGNAIIWTSILAAIHSDGVIQPDERVEAIRQTHVRSFTSADYFKPIYLELDDRFEHDFDTFSSSLPEDPEERELFVKNRLAECLSIVGEIGPLFTKLFSEDLESFYDRVFNANSSVFQQFVFPFLSPQIKRHNH